MFDSKMSSIAIGPVCFEIEFCMKHRVFFHGRFIGCMVFIAEIFCKFRRWIEVTIGKNILLDYYVSGHLDQFERKFIL
jgi:hypothetical protein